MIHLRVIGVLIVSFLRLIIIQTTLILLDIIGLCGMMLLILIQVVPGLGLLTVQTKQDIMSSTLLVTSLVMIMKQHQVLQMLFVM